MFLYHPVAGVIIAILVVLFLFNKILKPGEDFIIYKNQILITHSELEFGKNDCGTTLVVLGKIKNNSELSWENPQFEVKFFDNKNKLFDTGQDELYSFIIPPESEIPFKVTISKDFPEERYISHEIKLLTAKEKDTSF